MYSREDDEGVYEAEDDAEHRSETFSATPAAGTWYVIEERS